MASLVYSVYGMYIIVYMKPPVSKRLKNNETLVRSKFGICLRSVLDVRSFATTAKH